MPNLHRKKHEALLTFIRPQIHRTTTLVTNYLSSFNIFMYGGYKHNSLSSTETRQVPKQDDAGNIIMSGDGQPIMISKDIPKTTYSDTTIHGQAERVKALHPFPMPPFPVLQNGMPGPASGLANTLLRKRLEPKEEEWVEERLRKASEFAYVPGEWGIEPKKVEVKAEKDDNDSDDEDGGNAVEGLPTKRVKGTLSEDDILDLWKHAHQEAFDHQYLKTKYPEQYGEGDVEGDEEGETPGDDKEEEDEDEEDDFEDVMDTSGAPETSAAPPTSQPSEGPGSTSVAGRVTAPARPAVHQPVPGMPVLPLSFVHRFMTSGEISR